MTVARVHAYTHLPWNRVKRTHEHGKFSRGGIRGARQTPIFRPRLRMIGSLPAKAANIPYIKRARTRDKWESNRY